MGGEELESVKSMLSFTESASVTDASDGILEGRLWGIDESEDKKSVESDENDDNEECDDGAELT